MQKIRIISLEKDKVNVIAALHAIGAIDLRKSKLELGDDRPGQHAVELSDALIKVNGALQLLVQHRIGREKSLTPEALLAEVNGMSVLAKIYDLGNERKSISDDNRALDYAGSVAGAFQGIGIDFGRLKSNYLSYKAFEADRKAIHALKRSSRNANETGLETYISDMGKGRFLVLMAYSKQKNIDAMLKGIQLNELDLGAKYLDATPEAVLQNVGKRKAENLKRLHQIGMELAEISKRHYSRLANLREMLEIELARADVSSTFKRTESTFIIEGWIQKRQLDEVRQRMSKVTSGRVEIEEIQGDELAPTYTRRPGFLKPFDYLVSFYSVQRSDEIDPTWIFILSFPIFYGLMVTDVGYGIASFIIATLITLKYKDPDGLLFNAARIWQLNAIAAIFFGVLSNQFFGFQLPYSAPFHFDWLKNTPELIAITVLFGVAQVILGLFFGMINAYHHGHRKLAVAKFTSVLVVACGTVAVAGAFFGAFDAMTTEITGVVSIISLLLTGVLSGSEATEITNLITHPLSYARIMGFGLASVIIAFLIDMSFTPNLNDGILLFVLYAAIFVVLHLLNMLLSMFEGIVQGVRLNFVEFFSKFYIGNGIPYRPFSYKRVYTND
ncbi:MAG: hypothetical protein KGH72_02880 [Candidatus Micrarchaeota archaeon]|nr:hypothetical protein [Candidatus Micrarchaeota archaeon]